MIRFRPLPILTAVSLLVFVTLLALGQWQWRRAEGKRATIERLTGITAAPARVPGNRPAPLKDLALFPEWSPIVPPAMPDPRFCAGHNGGPGLATLRVSDAGRREFLLPIGDAVQGYVLVHLAEGPANAPGLQALCNLPELLILRRRVLPGRFGIPNRAGTDEFYWIDPDAMLSRLGLPAAVPGLYLAAPEIMELPTGAKRPNPRADPLGAQLLRPETHIGYSLTWFGLALVLVALYLAMHVARGRLSLPSRTRK